MKIFIDSAKADEIEEVFKGGFAEGITTNPSLIKKAAADLGNISMHDHIKHLCELARGANISLEVTETSYEGMVAQGKKLYKMFNPVANNVYIKIPVNPSFTDEPNLEGLQAIRKLADNGIPVNCTLIFTPEQALMAAKAGAKYVSPFAGRIDDDIRNQNGIEYEKTDYFPAYGWEKDGNKLEDNGIISGIELVRQIVDIFKQHNIKTEVLAASLRNIRQVREAALVGADIATIPYKVIGELLIHHKTQEGMKKFTEDIVPEYAELIK